MGGTAEKIVQRGMKQRCWNSGNADKCLWDTQDGDPWYWKYYKAEVIMGGMAEESVIGEARNRHAGKNNTEWGRMMLVTKVGITKDETAAVTDEGRPRQ